MLSMIRICFTVASQRTLNGAGSRVAVSPRRNRPIAVRSEALTRWAMRSDAFEERPFREGARLATGPVARVEKGLGADSTQTVTRRILL